MPLAAGPIASSSVAVIAVTGGGGASAASAASAASGSSAAASHYRSHSTSLSSGITRDSPATGSLDIDFDKEVVLTAQIGAGGGW